MELPEKQRLALTMFYFEEISYKEIAFIMNVNISSVKNFIHRGKAKLKEFAIEKDIKIS